MSFKEANGALSVKEIAIHQQIDLASSDEDQLQKKTKELATVTETLAQKEAELQLKNKELSNMSECLQKKDKELSELKLSTSDIHTIKSALDEANVNLAALGKKIVAFKTNQESKHFSHEKLLLNRISQFSGVSRYQQLTLFISYFSQNSWLLFSLN